ncbi:MAG: mRNA splicing protein prp18 [Tremellales sp. Tagirdzhanova-0007]|nr:MAG: mRNA splicing protein prp18 [Tremellales sp. Tagirdzhanova-0007]
MDGLLAEISVKRKALLDEPGGTKKYMRRADIEQAKEDEARRKKEEVVAVEAESRASKMRKDAEEARLASLSRLAALSTPTRRSPEPLGSPAPTEAFNISPDECVRRLRSKGQPIRLFGESDKDRRLRLRALELLEERGGSGGTGLNDFRRTLADMESGMDARDVERKAKLSHRARADVGEVDGEVEKEDGIGKKVKNVEVGVIDLGLVKTDPNKLYPLVYYALKNVLKEWEEFMDTRDEDLKRSSQGKLAAATQVQSAQNLKPLFHSLRSRDMLPDVIRHLAEIVHHMQVRSYQRANDAYLRLSIGNAAWPIGVTSVGIHERSAREKIGQDNIAHVLNDEVSRKYIQAVKRLLTFSQIIRPPADVSQLMG